MNPNKRTVALSFLFLGKQFDVHHDQQLNHSTTEEKRGERRKMIESNSQASGRIRSLFIAFECVRKRRYHVIQFAWVKRRMFWHTKKVKMREKHGFKNENDLI